MEGYSVMEAASILGVPSERVWELLARGVLAGGQDADTGMRVYLRPEPAPAPRVPLNEEPVARAEPERELSPFRELLTEFRNLTERDGQALLALGEARGEVAALRARVDLLEARIDLRLPASAPSSPRAAMPAPVSASVTEPVASDAAPDPEPAVDAASTGTELGTTGEEAPPTRRRRNGQRHATENFAEALARAQDPSPPELLSPAAAAALAARGGSGAEIGESSPREAAPAEEMPVADDAVPADDFAAGLDAELVDAPQTGSPPAVDLEDAAAHTERVGPLRPVGREPVEVSGLDVVEERLAAHDADMAALRAEHVAVDGDEAAVEIPAQSDERIAKTSPDLKPVAGLHEASEAFGVQSPDEISAHGFEPQGDVAWNRDRYSATIEEPDWYLLEEQKVTSADDAVDGASSAARPSAPPHLSAQPAGGDPDAATAQADSSPASMPNVMSHTDASLSTDPTALDEGADEIEFAARGPAAPARAELPGARELDDALAALDALGGSPRFDDSPASPSQSASESANHRALSRGLRGPTSIPPSSASRAYRRLRRIFPG